MRKITAAYNTVAAGGKAKAVPGKGGKSPRYETIIDVVYESVGPGATIKDDGPDEVLTVGDTTLTYYTAPKGRGAACDVEGKDKKLVKQIKDLIDDISDLSDINGPDRKTAEMIADLLKGSSVKKEKITEGWYSILGGGGKAKGKATLAVVYTNGKDECIVYAGKKISTRWYDFNAIVQTLEGSGYMKHKTKDDALLALRNIAYSKTDTSAL